MNAPPLYRSAPHARETRARVVSLTPEGGIICDQALFYPRGGGQPGDSGWLDTGPGTIPIREAVKGDGDRVVLLPDPETPLAPPAPGSEVGLRLDWARRYLHMRVHTALHLLSVAIPLPVTGGQIGAGRGRLDFAMPEPPADPAGIEAALNDLVARDLPVSEDWITDAELAAHPGLVKTMSVAPPSGQGRVRLVRIGSDAEPVDLQPCGGTHVARTSEIGPIRLGKIENKGRQNRRVHLVLDV